MNDLLKDYEACELGVRCDDFSVPALAYADDIVLLASDPRNLQKLIDKTTEWCCENDILINAEKTKIIHFRLNSTCTPFIIMTKSWITVASINTWVIG